MKSRDFALSSNALMRTAFLLAFIVMGSLSAYAQCPKVDYARWPKGSTVYYDLSQIPDPDQRAQIEKGLGDWNTANGKNLSGVTFKPGPPPAGTASPNTLVFKNGTIAAADKAAQMQPDSITGDGINKVGNDLKAATITFDTAKPVFQSGADIFEKYTLHELGHSMGLGDAPLGSATDICSQPNGVSVMNQACGVNDSTGNMPTDVQSCDNNAISSTYEIAYNPCWEEEFVQACEANGGIWKGCRGCYSPIVVDTLGDGFNLTSAADGVSFDIDGDGIAENLSWTVAGSDDAWLFLDRNGNGSVDSGLELFGNYTSQPESIANRNGFIALAQYDKPQHGGNSDALIDEKDAIFSSLRLWQDMNHNGISEAGELHTLLSLNVESISLEYRESGRRDRWGNTFRYRAKIYGVGRSKLGRWTYDVFLLKSH